MISCKTRRQGIEFPLQEYRRHKNPNLPNLWRMVGFKPVSQSRALRNIEEFVDTVVSSTGPAFIVSDGAAPAFSVHQTKIGLELVKVLPLLGLFDSEHAYTEKPYAFLDACWLFENIYQVDFSLAWSDRNLDMYRYADAMNGVVDKIRMSSRQDWFLRGQSDRRYEASCRANKIRNYVSGLLQRRSKLLFVRVDLGYAKFIRKDITIDRLHDDLREFLYLKDWHNLFEHLVGYVWTIEDGFRKGPHAHLLLIYSGSNVRQDITISEMVCRLWENRVTYGIGSSRNCNAKKHEYHEIGIGMIERRDPAACERAVYFATYLAKDPHGPEIDDPQYVRMKPAGIDTFGTGEQSLDEPDVGRPPIHPKAWAVEDMRGVRWPNSRWDR